MAFKDSVVEILPSNWKILVEFESGLLIVESVVQGLFPATWSHMKKCVGYFFTVEADSLTAFFKYPGLGYSIPCSHNRV